MLMAENQLKQLQSGHKLIKFFGYEVHDFEKETGKFLVHDHQHVLKAQKRFPFGAGMIFIISCQIIIAAYLKVISTADLLQCIFLMVAYSAMVVATWSMISQRKEIEQLFSHMLEFERTHNGTRFAIYIFLNW